jgi:hypothetical protein
VLVSLTAYLSEELENPWAQALMGEIAYMTGDYGRTTSLLKGFSDRLPDNVKLAFMCGHAFYARANDQLAKECLERALAAVPGKFNVELVEGTRTLELYVMRDRARTMLAALKGRVRYGDFVIKSQVSSPAQGCFDAISGIWSAVPGLVKALRAASEVATQLEKLDGARSGLRATPAYKPKEREDLKRSLRHDAVILKGILETVIKASGARDVAVSGPCPAGGIYHLNESLEIDCTEHRRIFAGARLETALALTERERRAIGVAIHVRLCEAAPELVDCLGAQRRILTKLFAAGPDAATSFAVPKDADLAALIQSGELNARDVDRGKGERLAIVAEGDEGILVCNRHMSYQRLVAIEPDLEVED